MSMTKSESGKLGALKFKENLKLKQIKDKEQYYLAPKLCKHCNNPHEYDKRKNKFCSSSCATTFNNLLKGKSKTNCISCSKEMVGKHKKYCDNKCQNNYSLEEKVKNGEASTKTLKRYLLKNYGNKCWTCGITEWNNKSIVMELEHIDGNSENNHLENLSLICPNCHSQTPTYKGANKGNGRHYRKVRYQEGKSY
jgi:hypothetical protein